MPSAAKPLPLSRWAQQARHVLELSETAFCDTPIAFIILACNIKDMSFALDMNVDVKVGLIDGVSNEAASGYTGSSLRGLAAFAFPCWFHSKSLRRAWLDFQYRVMHNSDYARFHTESRFL